MRTRLTVLLAVALCVPFSTVLAQRHDGASRAFLGFDRNQYPGDGKLPIFHRTFAFAGYWLNNPPGERSNSWAGKRRRLEDAGFGFLVLFNGKTYAQIRSGNAAAQGKGDGQAAVRAAIREGFPKRTIIFLDQEEGGRMLPAQRAYLHAWIDAVARSGYRAGVYCSGVPFQEGDGKVVITALDIRNNAGGKKISFWVSNDACPPSPGCVTKAPPEPRQSGVSFADVWQYAQSPRRKNLTAQCAETYSSDGECYAPSIPQRARLHLDLNSATSSDPSHGRGGR